MEYFFLSDYISLKDSQTIYFLSLNVLLCKFEFLVCSKMLDYNAKIIDSIRAEANRYKNEFVRDPRKPKRLNTFDGSEHRNVLYVMSGLDV